MLRNATLALALLFALPSCAEGLSWDWAIGTGNPSARHHRSYHQRHQRYRPKVMAYEKRSKEADRDRDDRAGKCVGKVRGLGTQWIGTEGALNAAKKDWMERVRYDHGESYIDMTNAQDFVSRCGRVSIGEVAGQVTYRCEIVARPCKAPMQAVEKKEK